MKQNTKKRWIAAGGLIAAFVVWTAAVRWIDVRPIGPLDSCVGFAAVNRLVHNLTGVNMFLYTLTDWLGLVPVFIGFGFAVLGLVQWIRRKRILAVDHSILVLGGFYLVVIAAYCFFEAVVINARPVLINGRLEASYPSSTTMLVMCVIPTAVLQLNDRIGHKVIRRCAAYTLIAFMAFMITGRLLSGVHWLTDIVGGALLSAGLVQMYRGAVELTREE